MVLFYCVHGTKTILYQLCSIGFSLVDFFYNALWTYPPVLETFMAVSTKLWKLIYLHVHNMNFYVSKYSWSVWSNQAFVFLRGIFFGLIKNVAYVDHSCSLPTHNRVWMIIKVPILWGAVIFMNVYRNGKV